MTRIPRRRSDIADSSDPQSDPLVDTLGERVRALRKLHDLSLDGLAQRADLTKSYLSKVERGLSAPSLATVLKLAKAFKLTTGQLLGESVRDDEVVVVRPADRVPFSRSRGRDGYTYEAIAAHRISKRMMPFVMRPPTQVEAPELVEHAGEELVFVLKGTIEIHFKKRSVQLHAGDAAYFDASVPHRTRSVGAEQAEALVVVSEPSPPG